MKLLLALILIVTSTISMAEEKKGRGLPPGMTQEQADCVKGILGEPGKGERPSRDKMDAAFSQCGVQKPQGGPPQDGKQENNQESN